MTDQQNMVELTPCRFEDPGLGRLVVPLPFLLSFSFSGKPGLKSSISRMLTCCEETPVNHLEKLHRTNKLRSSDKHGSKKKPSWAFNPLPMWYREGPRPQTCGLILIVPIFSKYSRYSAWCLRVRSSYCGAWTSCPFCALLKFLTHKIVSIKEWLLFYMTKFEVDCYSLIDIWNNSIFPL